VQDVGGEFFGDAYLQPLQAGPHAGDGAVMVAALDIDGVVKATLPFGDVIGDIGHEVGVAAFGFAHHPVFVIAGAQLGGAQPERAFAFIGMARVNKRLDRLFDAAAGVQRAFQVEIVEFQAKGLQVEILLAAQVSDSEAADVIQAVGIAGGGDGSAVGGLYRLAGQKVFGDIDDIVAFVAIGGEIGGIGGDASRPRLHTDGQIIDLIASVVVIELAGDVIALGIEQPAERIAQGCLAGVADMQRPGGVG